MAPAGAGASAASAVLDGDQDGESLLADATANTRAMIETTNAIIRANTVDDVVRGSLDTIRKAFGWAYASYWSVDPAEHALVFTLDSGRVDDEFQRHTRAARFREGEGLNGRAWRQRDLFFVEDLSQLRDCSRAPLATRAGIRSGIALPIFRDGQVIGTMDFFATDAVEVSPTRLDALRTIAQLASDKASTLGKQVELTRIMQMVENAPVNMMCADLDMRIQYMNPHAVKTLKKLEAHLPMKVDQMLGQSIDMFHKQPEHQRRLLADPRNLPRTATIRVGPEFFELSVSAMVDQNGRYIGPMITWEVVTEQARGQGQRGGAGRQHHGGQPVAPGPGPGPDCPRRDHLGPGRPSARRSAGRTDRSGRSSPRNRHCGSLKTRARSARTSAGSRPRRGSAREKGSTARPGRRGTWSSCPTWAR